MGVASFADGTAHVRVSAGSAVILGSKIDTASNDPTNLEHIFGGCEEWSDGTYQFALYDRLDFTSGGYVVIDDAVVTAVQGTFINCDKIDVSGEPECPLIFQWDFDLGPTDVGEFADGVEFTDS